MVYKAMEDGADLLIKSEKDMATPIIAEEPEEPTSEQEEDEDVTLVPDL